MARKDEANLNAENQELAEEHDGDLSDSLDAREAATLKEEEEAAELDSLGRSP